MTRKGRHYWQLRRGEKSENDENGRTRWNAIMEGKKGEEKEERGEYGRMRRNE